MSDNGDGLRIIKLQAEGFKRLSAIEIAPDSGEPVVRITGANEQGKSTVLEAIAVTLGGKRLSPRAPIKTGEDRAEVTVDLGKYVVTRTWTRGKDNGKVNSYLTVTNAEGASYPSPQDLLDDLVGDLSFDPLAFMRMKPADQRDALIELTGLGDKLQDIDARRKTAFDERTEKNREVKRLEGVVSDFADLPETAPEKIDLAALQEEQRQVQQARESWQARQRSVQNAMDRARQAASHVQGCEKGVADLEGMLARAREKLETAKSLAENAKTEADEATQAFEATECPSTQEIEQKIREATEANVAASAVAQRIEDRGKQQAALGKAKSESDTLTKALNACDAEKAELLSGAALPVEGLGFDADGATLGGLPLEQASSAQKLQTSCAIGMAKNPDLRVMLIDDGEKLDAAHYAQLSEQATTGGYQVWMAEVEESGQVGIVIVDGSVAAVDGQPATQPELALEAE